mmetsp:Transcript_141604/g.394741  ORF Transcript_141604/g.394741 Transcript_141604/m.394741 type:complete len:920 (+) Transcript_141604:85-2844(+)|eukprot:CAMPEP_0179057920 /NCGR_PEP_ID=MMETSP0796-20121207/24582_1 /TAXON_ID=73915 /ORGANISM="Pyrodinium bahamense, Strain pbaha01" /LENGTH=919 /DNA_ID=CAMNT_0020754653 /DNA_START=78 /DNA_END=2837 /DNA_ORIENTATION=+
MCRLQPFVGLLAAWLWQASQAQIMSVDLGHEFFKVALMRQGKPLEIVLNSHSKRKSSTAVSFFESIRVFGDDALGHQGKAPAKVPMFFHSLMGRNYTGEDVKETGKWWADFGLGDKFYSYKLGYNEERGVPTFLLAEGNDTEPEEVLAHILQAARKMTEASSEGKAVRDLVVTMPSDASLRQRQAVVSAGEIAGLRVLTLVHEGSAFAVQRAVDFQPEKGNSELILFYNLGSRKAEVSIVRFESRSAGMVAGKTAPVVTVLGSAIDFGIGGHLMDLKIADSMLKKFQEKNPKLADGIVGNPRALRKLLSQAQKTKAILSSNKVAPFIVESLYEDTDFQTTIKREDFEEMCKDMFARLTDPIDKALKIANATMPDIQQVELVGGGWRVPKVQELLSEFFEAQAQKKLPLGQHLNGEEAAALGAALVAANSSSSFRVKKIFFTDITNHEYAVQVVSLKGEWEKNVTTLYPLGTPLGGKKKLTFNLEEDFAIRVFEDGVFVSEYTVTGITEVLSGKWKEYNMTGSPKISVSVPLEMSGILEVKSPLATVEELYWVNVTKEKPKANATKANTTQDNGTDAGNATEDEEAAKPEEEAQTAKEENATEADRNDSSNGTAEEVEVVQKQKKRKHEKKLTVKRMDFKPVPIKEERISELKAKLEAIEKQEEDVLAVAGMRNELEAAIYGSRDKLERDDIIKVSTEEQRAEVTKLGTEYEEWMYESGATKTDYEQRLTSLQGLLGPMEERALELESRPDVVEQVTDALDDMKKTQAHVEKNMSWVNPNKTQAAAKKLTDFEEWWQKKKTQQDGLPLHEAPAFTKKDVVERLSKVQKEWEKLKKTKKPKEAPKAKASKNQTDGDAKASAKEEEALPSDPAEVEKEIAAVREKKASAVENEDYDTADKLKQREKSLQKHLEKLKAEKSEL